MISIHFTPWIDLMLVAVTLSAFLLHCEYWARSDVADTPIDLVSRLPMTRVRLISLFAVIAVLCWGADVAAWIVLSMLVMIGVIVAVTADFEHAAIAIPWAIREWAFGLPLLTLHPTLESQQVSDVGIAEQVGTHGAVVSPLRPFGQVEVDGHTMPAQSDSGEYIDAGAVIVVCGARGGCICVRRVHMADETSGCG